MNKFLLKCLGGIVLGSLLSCGLLDVTPCNPGQETWKPVDGSMSMGVVEWMMLADDSTQKDSMLIDTTGDTLHATLHWKSRCNYLSMVDSLGGGSARTWLVTALYSNWGWSGVSCEVLPFKYKGGSVFTSDTAVRVSWGQYQCEDTSKSTTTTVDDDDDDLFD